MKEKKTIIEKEFLNKKRNKILNNLPLKKATFPTRNTVSLSSSTTSRGMSSSSGTGVGVRAFAFFVVEGFAALGGGALFSDAVLTGEAVATRSDTRSPLRLPPAADPLSDRDSRLLVPFRSTEPSTHRKATQNLLLETQKNVYRICRNKRRPKTVIFQRYMKPMAFDGFRHFFWNFFYCLLKLSARGVYFDKYKHQTRRKFVKQQRTQFS